MSEAPAGAPAVERKPGAIMDELLQGAPDEVKKPVLDVIGLFSQGSEGEGGVSDREKSEALRAAFNSVQGWILSKKLSEGLNKAQKIFLVSGALADVAVLKTEAGDIEVPLLEPAIYDAIAEALDKKQALPEWTELIFDADDKLRSIAAGDLEPYDPDRRIKKGQMASQKADQKRIIDDFKVKMEVLAKATAESASTAEQKLALLIQGAGLESLKKVKLVLDQGKKVRAVLASGKDLKPEETAVVKALVTKLQPLSKESGESMTKVSEAAQGVKESFEKLAADLMMFARYKEDLQKVQSSGDVTSTRKRFIAFDPPKIDAIKRENEILKGFLPSSAEKSPQRMAYSGSRILVKDHMKHAPDPREALCTTETVAKAFEKVAALHVNLFQRDPRGAPIIPPVMIEPIRNFVDWFDDRIIMGFVSGDMAKKGSNTSFTSAEMQVLRACGIYLAKDPIYDYRGEIAGGTFMGDYAGQVEKKAAVKWTGENKKFSVVSATDVSDGASREEAAQDYMDFIFNMANNLPPNSKLSQRKKGILFRYVVFESPLKSASLALRYCFQADPLECKEIVLKYCENSADKARALIEEVFKADPQTGKMLGGNPAYVNRKLFQ